VDVQATDAWFEHVTVTGVIVKVCQRTAAADVKKGDHFKGGKKNACKAAGGTSNSAKLRFEWDEISPSTRTQRTS
jgi:hypothetical protein